MGRTDLTDLAVVPLGVTLWRDRPALRGGAWYSGDLPHAVDEDADHPYGVYVARCEQRLFMGPTLYEEPPGWMCMCCLRWTERPVSMKPAPVDRSDSWPGLLHARRNRDAGAGRGTPVMALSARCATGSVLDRESRRPGYRRSASTSPRRARMTG